MLIGIVLPLLLMFLDVNIVTVLLVGLGQAHFIHCYIYQYRAGKMDADFLLKLGLGLSLAIVGCVYLGDDVMIPAALVFIVHQFFDDFYLYRQQVKLGDMMQLGLVMMACFVVPAFEMNDAAQYVAGAAVLLAVAVGILSKQRLILYTLSLPFALPLWYVLQDYQHKDWLIPLGVIIVSHYLRWMMHVYQQREPAFKQVFFSEALILNVVFVLYAVATVAGLYSERLSVVLQGLFSIQAFVVWTMAHIFSTIRPRLLAGTKKSST